MKNTKLVLILFVLLISVLSITGLIIGLQNKNKMNVGSKAAELTETTFLQPQGSPPSGSQFLADCTYVECNTQSDSCKCYGRSPVPTDICHRGNSATPIPSYCPTPTPDFEQSPCESGTCPVTNLRCLYLYRNQISTRVSWKNVQNAQRYAIRVQKLDGTPFECNKGGDKCIDTLTPNRYAEYYFDRSSPSDTSYRVWIHAINSSGLWGEQVAVECIHSADSN